MRKAVSLFLALTMLLALSGCDMGGGGKGGLSSLLSQIAQSQPPAGSQAQTPGDSQAQDPAGDQTQTPGDSQTDGPSGGQDSQSATVKDVLCANTWYTYCGGDLLYVFYQDGTGRVVPTVTMEDGGSLSYYFTGDSTVTILEGGYRYTWEYAAEENVFLWDIFAAARQGTGDFGELNAQGLLPVYPISKEQYEPLLPPTSDFAAALCQQVAQHYNQLWAPSGTYTCYDSEMTREGEDYVCLLRYAMSDAEAEEILAGGGIPTANVLVAEVRIDRTTGRATDDLGNSWTVVLP